MAMSIEEAIKQLETYTIPCGKYKAAYDLAVDTMRKYQMFQADYENRLKADMVAMLKELKAEIEEMHNANPSYWYTGDMVDREDLKDLIQEKINSLKED